jgi:hypothetical protein
MKKAEISDRGDRKNGSATAVLRQLLIGAHVAPLRMAASLTNGQVPAAITKEEFILHCTALKAHYPHGVSPITLCGNRRSRLHLR